MERHLLSDEYIVQEFILHALKEYPYTPAEWTDQILNKALHAEEHRSKLLVWAKKEAVHEKSVPLLIRLLEVIDSRRKHLVMNFVYELKPEIILQFDKQLNPYLTEEFMKFNRFLLESGEDDLWEEYYSHLSLLESKEYYDHDLFIRGKKLLDMLVQRTFYTEADISLILQQEMERQWFSYNGIFAVRAIGLLKLEQYIPDIANMLSRDEDVLLEEITEALTRFQNDEVVKEVAPFVLKDESQISALAVLANTKTESAEEILYKCYSVVKEEGKGLIIEALSHHLSPKTFSLIDDFLDQEYENVLIDMEQIFYSFYTIMGKKHPYMDSWKSDFEEREKYYQKINQLHQPIRNESKVGRNDPCPCGSGKKYKKCCGK